MVNYQIDTWNITKDFVNDLNSRGLSSELFFSSPNWELDHFTRLYETLSSLKAHNLEFPMGLKESDYEMLSRIQGLQMTMLGLSALNYTSFTHDIASKIIDTFEAKILGYNKDEFFTLLSGEKDTMMNFLAALKLVSYACLRD